MPARVALLATCLLAACAASEGPRPETVEPAPADGDAPAADAARPRAADTRPADTTRTVPGAGLDGGLVVVDADGVAIGRLFRRGSDDNLANRAIYDLVTVFHPESGLFFEVTLNDGLARLPATTYFTGAFCDKPVGVAAGGCSTCRSGPGIGILHGGAWYVVRPGATFVQASASATMGSGVDEDCVAHGVSNAKVFPVDPVTGPRPPASFAPPLRIEWR